MLGNKNILGAIKANNKDIADKIRGQIHKLSECINGYRRNIKNTIKKTTPKDLGEDFSVGICLADSNNIIIFHRFILLQSENTILLP